jgi:membrane fusion protein (multidrug efflux system)
LELGGFRYQYTDLVVDSVSSEGVGPSEVRRFLGDEGGDAVDLEPGAKVLVSAHIPATTFHAEGRAYEYFDGLTGHAEVCVRRETILVSLLPTIRQWLK